MTLIPFPCVYIACSTLLLSWSDNVAGVSGDSEDDSMSWVTPVVAALSAGFLILFVVVAVLLACRYRRRKTGRRGSNDRGSISPATSETHVDRDSDGSTYNHIYSVLDAGGPQPPKRETKGPVPSNSGGNSGVPPPLPSREPERLRTPPPDRRKETPDLGPPAEMAPIPPMTNPLAGRDMPLMDDDHLSDSDREWGRDQAPARHQEQKSRNKFRRRNNDDDRHGGRRRRYDNHGDRERHRRDRERVRVSRRTVEAPSPPEYIPVTVAPIAVAPVVPGTAPVMVDATYPGPGTAPVMVDATYPGPGYRPGQPYTTHSPPPYYGGYPGVADTSGWDWRTMPAAPAIPRAKVPHYQ